MLRNFDQAEINDYDEVVVALVGVGSHTSFQIKLDLDISSREAPPAKQSIIEPKIKVERAFATSQICIFWRQQHTYNSYFKQIYTVASRVINCRVKKAH